MRTQGLFSFGFLNTMKKVKHMKVKPIIFKQFIISQMNHGCDK